MEAQQLFKISLLSENQYLKSFVYNDKVEYHIGSPHTRRVVITDIISSKAKDGAFVINYDITSSVSMSLSSGDEVAVEQFVRLQ